ncbi:MAG: ornithine cyclodeaminase family protein [Clostridia bacterium]
MEKTLIINRRECEKLLTYERCIPAMKEAFLDTAVDEPKVLGRQFLVHENGKRFALMPGSSESNRVTGGKFIFFSGQGIVPLFDIDTGKLIAITDAHVLTLVRTASTSAAATDVLANKDAKTLAILGGGNQGKAHAIAISKVRNIEKIYVWSYKESTINSCIQYIKENLPSVEVVPCINAKDAVINADIICTTTSARTNIPILKGEWLKKGVHINAVGACSAVGIECDSQTIKKCKVYTDWTKASVLSSGDLAIPLKNGEIEMSHILGEVGKVLTGKIQGRTAHDDMTFFESVGISIQDVVSAYVIYKAAKDENMGIFVEI